MPYLRSLPSASRPALLPGTGGATQARPITLAIAAMAAMAASLTGAPASLAGPGPSASFAPGPGAPVASGTERDARPARRRPGAFPVAGLLPKEEIGATRLRREHPRVDGRGVVVAIFDTGVDPGAAGLQVTTTGAPKIVDLVDASGSGDVDTSTVRRAEDGSVEGLSGRRLELGRGGRWRNPSGEWHVGLKPAWELFPHRLLPRLKERRLERWREEQRAAEAALLRELAGWDREHPRPSRLERDERDELERRLEVLREIEEEREDLGPVFDCLTFHDGRTWRGVVDTDEDGELGDEAVLADYRLEREHATFGDEDLLHFALNVYRDGDLLSIVTDTGAHGTHVAGIVAGHFPDEPELDGIAPGAQLVGVKIGDTRVGSSSLGTGESRGLVATLANGCDVINMSYGGPSALPDRGRQVGLYSEIVNDHGVVFVASAGNEGPALSTVGSPGGTTSAILGVGATVTPALVRSAYALREELPETQFTWSSRGPALDGDLGVDVTAPGGAVAPMPTWSLQPSRLMNGTSMSSPSTAGGVALLVSGSKQRGVAWSPASIRRALQATARPVEGQDAFTQGAGLIQLDRAFEHLLAHRRDDDVVRYDVEVTGTGDRRGVYLREPREVSRAHDVSVSVEPRYPKGWDDREKVGLQLRLSLESTADWVEAPEHLLLSHGGRRFSVRVDPTGLPHGAHFAEVIATDVDDPDAGPRFRVPFTVIRPRSLEARDGASRERLGATGSAADDAETLAFRPGRVVRRFLAAPEGATWADVVLRAGAADERRRFVLQCVQLVPGRSADATSKRWYLWLEPGEELVRSLPVVGGRTLEVALAQYWSSLGETEVELEVSFHGLVPEPAQLFMPPGALGARLDVTAPLRREDLDPQATLDVLRRPLRPADATIRPLPGPRDLLPEARREHELVLEYEVELDEKRTVRPRLAVGEVTGVDDLLESGLWTLLDSGGRVVATSTLGRAEVEVGAGTHRLLVHLRHDDPEMLERLERATAWLDVKLDKEIRLAVRPEGPDLVAGEGRLERRTLEAGERISAWVAAPGAGKAGRDRSGDAKGRHGAGGTRDGLPKTARAGDVLLGTFRLGPEQTDSVGAGHRPGGWPLAVAVGPKPSGDGEEGGNADAEDRGAKDDDANVRAAAEDGDDPDLEELLLEARLGVLAKLRDEKRSDDFERLAEQLSEGHRGNLTLALERLRHAKREGGDPSGADQARSVVAAARDVVAAIDVEALAAWQGRRRPDEPRTPSERREREERQRERDALREALLAEARALAELAENDGEEARRRFEEAWDELAAWADPDDEGFRRLKVRRERLRGRPGAALEVLGELLADAEPDRELHELRIELLRDLGWDHLAREESRWLAVRFRPHPPPF